MKRYQGLNSCFQLCCTYFLLTRYRSCFLVLHSRHESARLIMRAVMLTAAAWLRCFEIKEQVEKSNLREDCSLILAATALQLATPMRYYTDPIEDEAGTVRTLSSVNTPDSSFQYLFSGPHARLSDWTKFFVSSKHFSLVRDPRSKLRNADSTASG